jgi:hypothetical protein
VQEGLKFTLRGPSLTHVTVPAAAGQCFLLTEELSPRTLLRVQECTLTNVQVKPMSLSVSDLRKTHVELDVHILRISRYKQHATLRKGNTQE